MARFTAIGESPPVAPGESPFRARGTSYLGHLSWVDQHYPGGRAAFLARMTPPMQAFFSQSFLPITMYDFLPLAAAGQVCARSTNMTFVQFIEMRGRHQAEIDIGGMYRLLLKLTSARMIAAKLPGIMARYFDFGAVRVVSDEPNCVRFEAQGIPQLLVDWFRGCYAGYVHVVVGAAGGVTPSFDFEAHAGEDLHGFPATTMACTIRWASKK